MIIWEAQTSIINYNAILQFAFSLKKTFPGQSKTSHQQTAQEGSLAVTKSVERMSSLE